MNKSDNRIHNLIYIIDKVLTVWDELVDCHKKGIDNCPNSCLDLQDSTKYKISIHIDNIDKIAYDIIDNHDIIDDSYLACSIKNIILGYNENANYNDWRKNSFTLFMDYMPKMIVRLISIRTTAIGEYDTVVVKVNDEYLSHINAYVSLLYNHYMFQTQIYEVLSEVSDQIVCMQATIDTLSINNQLTPHSICVNVDHESNYEPVKKKSIRSYMKKFLMCSHT